MGNGYYFKSTLFQIEKGEDEETNPGCYGKQLGEWLILKFAELGYDMEELIAEDWGWCVMFSNDYHLLWIGCVSMFEDDFEDTYDPDNPPKGEDVVWQVFPEIEIPILKFKSWLKNLFGKLDTVTPLNKIDDDLKKILENEPKITFCESL